MTQIQNNFTELFLMMRSAKILQMVPLHWSVIPMCATKGPRALFLCSFFIPLKKNMYDEPYLFTEFLSKWAEKIMKSVQEAAIFVSIILHHKNKSVLLGCFLGC